LAALAALGIALSILAFSVVLGIERDRHQREFEFKAANRIAALQSGVDFNVKAVHSLQSLYSASESVNREDFSTFVRNEFDNRSQIQALEWIPRVLAEDRESFEASMREEGLGNFTILERLTDGTLVPATERAEYFPVSYLEPYSGNEAATGFDLASNPSRYEALKISRDSGNPVATQRIVLVQEVGNQFGFLVFVPIYEKGAVTSALRNVGHLFRASPWGFSVSETWSSTPGKTRD